MSDAAPRRTWQRLLPPVVQLTLAALSNAMRGRNAWRAMGPLFLMRNKEFLPLAKIQKKGVLQVNNHHEHLSSKPLWNQIPVLWLAP